jgi:hypothetical protein
MPKCVVIVLEEVYACEESISSALKLESVGVIELHSS